MDKFLSRKPNSEIEIIGSFALLEMGVEKLILTGALLILLNSVFSLNANFDELAVFSPGKLRDEVIIELYIFKKRKTTLATWMERSSMFR